MSQFSSLNVKEPEDVDFSCKYLSQWSGYFKKSIQERQESVHNESNEAGSLPLNIADIMIENCIGTLSLPLGISPNFVINNKHVLVPFCVEEPSIVAAASSVSKLIAKNGGFTTSNSERNIMIGQIQIKHVHNHIHKAIDVIQHNESKYIQIGNGKYCASMVQRGGGIIAIKCRQITPRTYKHNKVQRESYLVVHVHIDVCDAMGANKVNTVCEGLSAFILNDLTDSDIHSASIGLKILSNLCTERMTISTFCIPVDKLSWKGVNGMAVATKIIEAYEFAIDDTFRASTNNKGVMNGMDAVAIAMGQDWRAIESAAHCYAYLSNEDAYGPLAHYFIEYSAHKQCQCLYGYLNIPIAVGSRGGSVTTHPAYQWMLNELVCALTAKDIANIIVSAGLSSNFGALRALAIEGIQKGHMRLHATNIAMSVLSQNEHHLVKEVAEFMIQKESIHSNVAKRYIVARNIEFASNKYTTQVFPSTLVVEIPTKNGTVSVDVVIATGTQKAMQLHLEIKMDEEHKSNAHEERIHTLFGISAEQLIKRYHMMNGLNIAPQTTHAVKRMHSSVLSEIKLLSLLIHAAVAQYLAQHNDVSYIKAMCDRINGMKHNQDVQQFQYLSQYLIQSLLNALIYRINHNINTNFGRCLLKWLSLSFHSLTAVHKSDEEWSSINLLQIQNEAVGEYLKQVMFQQRNTLPVLTFASLNMMSNSNCDFKQFNQTFIALIEKCGLYLDCNMRIISDIKYFKDNNSGNLYSLYLKLSHITHTETHMQSFQLLMNGKIAELKKEIQQLLSTNDELQQWFDLDEVIKSIQAVTFSPS